MSSVKLGVIVEEIDPQGPEALELFERMSKVNPERVGNPPNWAARERHVYLVQDVDGSPAGVRTHDRLTIEHRHPRSRRKGTQ